MNAPCWNDGIYYDTVLEAQLDASLEAARRAPPPAVEPAAHTHTLNPISAQPHRIATMPPNSVTHAELIAGCGIAAIDGYLQMRDYAAGKGLDLVELKHKGIDLQDLVSTLIIDLQKRNEAAEPARRYRR